MRRRGGSGKPPGMSQSKIASKKTFRPKARTPRGFRDRFGADVVAERQVLDRVAAVYERYGFEPLDTSAFEYSDALGKFLPDTDRPNEGVFSLQDEDGQWMSLRYDLTAPLARHVAEHYDALPKPFRRYAMGPVWRNEKPGPGRYRQFTQCDADTVGAPAPHADVECVVMVHEAIMAAAPGLAFGIKLNDRNVLIGLLETLGVDEARDAAKKFAILRALDKFDRLGARGVALLLGAGRKDESGDFTEGAGLAGADIERVLAFMDARGATNAETCARLANLVGGARAGAKGVEMLSAMAAQLGALGFSDAAVKIDPSTVRGLEYYTGSVFEAELSEAPLDDKGRPVQIGSIAGGGRYDGLVERFKGVEVPAVGVSVGVSRLLTAIELTNKGAVSRSDLVVILALDETRMADYQVMARELRAAGRRAEVYVGGAGMKAQFKYADKRGARLVVIEGGDELARGEVTIKDLARGAELAKDIQDRATWTEDRPAQFSVKRQDLAAAVAKALS